VPSKSKLIAIPLPLRGLNTVSPFNIDLDSGYARELTNYLIKDGRLFIRPAVQLTASNAAFGTNVFNYVDPSPASVAAGFYAIRGADRFNIAAGTNLGALPGSPSPGVADQCYVIKHGDLTILLGAGQPRSTAGPAFTEYTSVTGVLPATIAIHQITVGCSHRGRLYFGAGTVLNWHSVGGVRGTMAAANVIDYSSFLDNQSISRVFSVTAVSGVSSESLFVIFGTGGKVLVFSGDNPLASNWNIVGSFTMPAPANRLCFVEVDGDIFVATAQYAYWFRDLLNSSAQSAYENSPTRAIENLWTDAGWVDPGTADGGRPHVFYLKELDLIISQSGSGPSINFSAIANYAGMVNYGYFVYHRKYKAFALWLSAPLAAGVQQNETSKVYYAPSFGGVARIATGVTEDTSVVIGTIKIETSWKTPYFAPFSGVGNKLNNVRVWFSNSLTGYFEKVRSIFDFSDYNAPYAFYTQSTVTQVDPGNYGDSQENALSKAGAQYNPLLGPSGNGGGFSLQFTQKARLGSVEGQVQSIYAATALVEEAGDLF